MHHDVARLGATDVHVRASKPAAAPCRRFRFGHDEVATGACCNAQVRGAAIRGVVGAFAAGVQAAVGQDKPVARENFHGLPHGYRSNHGHGTGGPDGNVARFPARGLDVPERRGKADACALVVLGVHAHTLHYQGFLAVDVHGCEVARGRHFAVVQGLGGQVDVALVVAAVDFHACGREVRVRDGGHVAAAHAAAPDDGDVGGGDVRIEHFGQWLHPVHANVGALHNDRVDRIHREAVHERCGDVNVATPARHVGEAGQGPARVGLDVQAVHGVALDAYLAARGVRHVVLVLAQNVDVATGRKREVEQRGLVACCCARTRAFNLDGACGGDGAISDG